MHLGSYEMEHDSVVKLHDFIGGEGYELSGLHDEIYLSDPNRTLPEKLKTILRQPVKKVE